jgi:heme/copper-type cytochrome/quinol oxidase subunit 3
LLTVLATIAVTFLYSYFYLRLYSDRWPQGQIQKPNVIWPAIWYGALAASALPQWWASHAWKRERHVAVRISLAIAAAIGLAFVIAETVSLIRMPFAISDNAYSSIFNVLSGMLLVYAASAASCNITVLIRDIRAPDDPRECRTLHLQVVGLIGYFVAVTATIVFATLYVSPYVI